MVGNPGTIGIDGPGDIKRALGSVPVQADGSAQFTIPANTPISIQPRDADGQALQLMRRWMSAWYSANAASWDRHRYERPAPSRAGSAR